jgi:CRISPR/Cas system-associated exonuclease Cas4 (RecB family)
MAAEFGGKYKVREKGLFVPHAHEPHRLSRSKLELFLECPRCLYLEQRYGVTRPETPSFTLNNAIDELLKREFDVRRAKGERHPLCKEYNIDAIPFAHEKLEEWRDALRRGIAYHHTPTNLLVRGGIDDVWQGKKGELYIVDYKATSKRKEIELYASYGRQAEIYQWLFRRNGFEVSDIAYFVYANGKSDAPSFDGKLEFEVQIIPHKGDDSWVEPLLYTIKETLIAPEPPPPGARCDYCPYREAAGKALRASERKPVKPPAIKRKVTKKQSHEITSDKLF